MTCACVLACVAGSVVAGTVAWLATEALHCLTLVGPFCLNKSSARPGYYMYMPLRSLSPPAAPTL